MPPNIADRFDHLSIAPHDFDASLRFYRDILKWQVTNEWTDEFGKRGAQLTGGGIRIVIAEPHEESGIRDIAGKANSHAATVHLDIHDADQRFASISGGDHVIAPPEVNHLGTRCFVVRDPDGNLITFNEMRQKH